MVGDTDTHMDTHTHLGEARVSWDICIRWPIYAFGPPCMCIGQSIHIWANYLYFWTNMWTPVTRSMKQREWLTMACDFMLSRLIIHPYMVSTHLYGQQCWKRCAVELSYVILLGLSIVQSPCNLWQEWLIHWLNQTPVWDHPCIILCHSI